MVLATPHPKGIGHSVPKFWTAYLRQFSLTHSKQIRHENTREGTCSTGSATPASKGAAPQRSTIGGRFCPTYTDNL